eukprot:TRINITY_DN2300_c0_g2_i1.p1 TRINITY_DN2300_c0_g2~~TRINITY_DN2300_c0_g2_i1.p1  ORF type:complete len:732 (+),score=246.69 TRINITY_DN2300_c0_g2_i1:54-2249(+)
MTNFMFFMIFLVPGVAAGDPKKSAAVDMVLKMLSDVATKVESEGEDEAKTFIKFDRFCNDTVEETNSSIAAAAGKIGTLNGRIKTLTSTNKQTTADMDELVEDIAKLKSTIKDKAAERAEDSADFASTSKDLGNAIYGIDKSIDELKAKQSTSFLQQQSFKKTVQAAALLADSLGMKSSSLDSLNAKDSSYEGIVTMLEDLQTEFRKKKEAADLEEAQAVNAFKLADQSRNNQLKSKQEELAAKTADHAQKTKEIGVATQDLVEATTAKKEGDAYLAEISASCAEKRAVNDQHVAGRLEELAALSQAKKIMEQAMAPSGGSASSAGGSVSPSAGGSASPSAGGSDGSVSKTRDLFLLEMAAGEMTTDQEGLLDAAEAEASAMEQEERSTPPSLGFLQMLEVQEHQPGLSGLSGERALLVSLLSRSAERLHSQRLAVLARKASSDPFAEVKEMISGLITKLQKQMAEDQDNKADCDKNIGAANLARDDASAAITQLNSELASTEARRDGLVEDMQELDAAVTALDKKNQELIKIRAEEAKEAAETIAESKTALAGVKQAKQVIADFYAKASEAKVPKPGASSTSTKSGSLLQSAKPEDEAYTGKQGASKGIIGTLEVIQSDFERTISETNDSESTADKEHQRILSDIAVSKAEKLKAKGVKKGFKGEADTTISDGNANLKGEMSKLKSALLQLTNLEAKCGVGVTYEARKAARAQEMQALQEAIATFDSLSR